ncbi:hypothetical protein QUB68_19860 [Microcoleus sp. A006_D1]|uniref:hypothetical protein n=1 Tax=Microcoleus sp. A006_D1 TaxID=3055267 RepID=UPI002FD23360
MGIQRYNFSTIALEVARSTLMTIHRPKTQPNSLNTIACHRSIGVSNSVTPSRNSKFSSAGCGCNLKTLLIHQR